MAALDFPPSPSIGQIYPPTPAAGMPTYRWDGTVWTAIGISSGGFAYVGDTPPADPADGALWFNSTICQMYVYYNDGNSKQWVVQVSAPMAVKPYKNYVINGAFQINQGGYVSAAVLAAAAYGHDQWKAGASGGDYSFTQSASSTTITIAAGKSLIQPIEDVRVVGGGNYVLAWTGTAQARAGVNTLTPAGAYAASPLLITGQTDGTVMSVEFNTGTLGGVSLTEGTTAPPFVVPDYASELALCMRYWQQITITFFSNVTTGTNYNGAAYYSVTPRGSPTFSGTNAFNTAFPATVGGFTAQFNSVREARVSNATAPGGFITNVVVNARL